jgi:diguanylate cyclase (GGDEF)-like protein
LDGNGLELIAPGLSGWNAEAYEQEMYMLTAGTRRLPAEFHDALTSAFHQVVLAVAGCRSHAELDHRANHDPLTQLPTRAKFFRRLAAEVDERMPGTVAVLNIDLDDFKQVNDSYGHAAGDDLLIQVAERIATAGGPGSMAARFGGDEFAVMLTDLGDPERAERIAAQVGELICARLVAPVHLREATVMIGASIGVAVSMPGLTAGDLMRCADIAMYSAKVQGKNRVQTFRAEQHGDAAEHRTREKHLASAADRGEIRIGYRPQPDSDTGAELVLESHVSWQHPLLGTVGRGDLMALAARTGNLQALGRHIVERTCAEIAALPGPPVRFTIDVTGRQLRDPAYASMVLGALEQTGIDPGRLELTVLGDDPLDPADGPDSLPARQLARLDANGVRIGLDAEHTHGFTLAMLRAYPIHRLTADENDAAAVALARTAGRVLGTRLVLRGAEADAAEMDHDEVAAWLESVTPSGRE